MAESRRILCAVRPVLLRVAGSWLVICVVAFAVRVAFVADQAHKIPAMALATVPFQNEAGSIAAGVASGQGFCCLFREATGPTAWLAPVYPLLIATIFKVFGTFTSASFYAAAVMNSLFSALACVPLYFTGKRIDGKLLGATAAWIWAFFPSGIWMPFEWIWDTSLSALLAALLLWATLELAESYSLRGASLYGSLWGAALLTNPALGILLPLQIGWIFYRHSGMQRSFGVRWSVLVLAIATVCCIPWAVRNAVQFHRWIPIRSNFAFELWLGNNEVFDEHSREVNRITRYEQVRRYAQLGESGFLDEKRQQAETFMQRHPALVLKLIGQKIVATWMGTGTPWQDFRRTDSLLVRFLFIWNLITVIGVMAGLGRLYWSHNLYAFPVATIPIVFPLIYYITHTSLRYRHPCDPVLALLLAVALVSVRSKPPDAITECGRPGMFLPLRSKNSSRKPCVMAQTSSLRRLRPE
jgi:4-amino-4-deoxy-L-arabinose transferase-like glycosyltransferase